MRGRNPASRVVHLARRIVASAVHPLQNPQVIEVEAGVLEDTCLQRLGRAPHDAIEVVVTRRGEVVARIVPADTHVLGASALLRGTLLTQAAVVAPDVEAWGDLRCLRRRCRHSPFVLIFS
jgi:hypothetical protein